MSEPIRYYDPDSDTLSEEEYEAQVYDDWASSVEEQAAIGSDGGVLGGWYMLMAFVVAAVVFGRQAGN